MKIRDLCLIIISLCIVAITITYIIQVKKTSDMNNQLLNINNKLFDQTKKFGI